MSMLPGEIALEQVRGLRPATWICVGDGYSREDLKELLLSDGSSLNAHAVTTVEEIAAGILGRPKTLDSICRQEVLRILISDPRVSGYFKELKRLKRQGNFFRRLDAAIQAGRTAAAHVEEEEVYSERLSQRFGAPSPLRFELRALASAYESWLEVANRWDPPRLLRAATARIQEQGWPKGLAAPEEIVRLTAVTPESLEREFWETLAKFVRLKNASEPVRPSPEPARWNWERWHTVDDACERLGEALSREADWRDHVILMADTPTVRRSVKRALKSWGVPELDPRDPSRLLWEEPIKWATLPLAVVAGNFGRDEVIDYYQSRFPGEDQNRVPAEINSRAVRNGLASYSGGQLTVLHAELSKLSNSLKGKLTCRELKKRHLSLLRESIPEGRDDLAWVVEFFEKLWTKFVEDYVLLKLAGRKAPLLYWFERLQERLSQAPAPLERLRPRRGIRIYRLQQAPLVPARHLWIVGLEADWLSAEGVGDYWLSERDREVLSAEFAVRSGIQVRGERLRSLSAWIAGAENVNLLDAEYGVDGREREALTPILAELAAGGATPPEEPLERGSHPRWSRSFGALRPLPPQEFVLPVRSRALTATALEAYSKCPFQALAYHRWKANDLREPDFELWQDVKGNLLHEAVRLLILGRGEGGGFGDRATELSLQALERAWETHPPKGLERSERVRQSIRQKLLKILVTFCEKEDEYRTRSEAVPISLDEQKFTVDFGDFTIVGKPDRIDEIAEGLFIIDYKTASTLPNGTQMLELGYRLQLPFYAIAVGQTLAKPVVGLQLISLSTKGGRNSGIFFSRFNGKEPGKLTAATKANKSVLAMEPEEAWPLLREKIQAEGRALVEGRFAARPKKADECSRCRVSDLCGFRRRVAELDEGEGGDER